MNDDTYTMMKASLGSNNINDKCPLLEHKVHQYNSAYHYNASKIFSSNILPGHENMK
jgi:hypothetical protein